MSCEHCIAPSGHGDTSKGCCWSTALEIRKFKKFVFHKYIIEVVFDLLVSVASVVTDIASLILYIQKGYWIVALITAIPVLLPTLVFTNVYMADETQGYCKLPPKKGRNNINRSPTPVPTSSQSTSSPDETNSVIIDSGSVSISFPGSSPTPNDTFKDRISTIKSSAWFHFPGCRTICSSCCGCWRGLCTSIFNKDRHLRKSGAETARKSLKRLSKYFFGTFVLRFISLAWYIKALTFGIKAFREPKRFMKIERPNAHWSYDLLVRLDFLQAALENAPQCIIQLYLLLTMPNENVLLGLSTLIFSFVDFVRVSVSVQWDIHRGPVIAPSGCYGKIRWKLLNWCSWIFLYIGRSCALAYAFATSRLSWVTLVPASLLILHIVFFMKLFSKSKYGVAAQKLIVSVFISLFFLPELYSNELPSLVKFYYACIHIQNIIFITPLQGFDYPICFTTPKRIIVSTPRPKTMGQNLTTPDALLMPIGSSKTFYNSMTKNNDCLIDPLIMVLLVPTLTMVGILMRLVASNKMSKFKKNLPVTQDKMIMEERVARLYRAKWSKLTVKHMTTAFLRMLRKEVVQTDDHHQEGKSNDGKSNELLSNEDAPVYFISPTLNSEFHASQSFIREAVAFLTSPSSFPINKKTQRSMSVDEYAIKQGRTMFSNGKRNQHDTAAIIADNNNESSFMKLRRMKSNSHDNLVTIEDSKKHSLLSSSFTQQSMASPLLVDIAHDTNEEEEAGEFVQVDSSNGPLFLEMRWI